MQPCSLLLEETCSSLGLGVGQARDDLQTDANSATGKDGVEGAAIARVTGNRYLRAPCPCFANRLSRPTQDPQLPGVAER